jgi:hypothetical protein
MACQACLKPSPAAANAIKLFFFFVYTIKLKCLTLASIFNLSNIMLQPTLVKHSKQGPRDGTDPTLTRQ